VTGRTSQYRLPIVVRGQSGRDTSSKYPVPSGMPPRLNTTLAQQARTFVFERSLPHSACARFRNNDRWSEHFSVSHGLRSSQGLWANAELDSAGPC